MKSEHRHELAENDLSKVLGRWGAEFDKHANTILTVLIVVTLLAAGVIYWTRTSAATSALGWTDLANANSAEDFQNVAEMYPGTPVAEWAMLRAADGFLGEGIRLSLTDRPASTERLSQAQSSYEALLNNSSVPKEIREQALMGYAVTLESVSDGDTTAAVSAYEKLVAEFPKTRFKAFAEDRVAELKTGGAQDFYAWFHRLNPKPADLPMPQDGMGSPGLGDLSILPELGGAGVPDTVPLNLPDLSGEAPKSGDEAPNPFAAEEMKKEPASEAPEKPASPQKPDSPDADKPAEKPAEKPAATEPPKADETQPAEPETEPEPKAEGTPSDDAPAKTPASETPPAEDAPPESKPETPPASDASSNGEPADGEPSSAASDEPAAGDAK